MGLGQIERLMTPPQIDDARRQALARHSTPEIFNTDQGSQFTGFAFTGRLREAGIRISMDGRGPVPGQHLH